MIKKIKDSSLILGLIFTIAAAFFSMVLSNEFFDYPRLEPLLFDAGVDALGTLTCAALYFGCIRQVSEGTRIFRAMTVLVSISFVANLLMCFLTGLPELNAFSYLLVFISKLTDQVLIVMFYQYVRTSLGFESRLSRWADRGFPILMSAEMLLILSNIFYPITFYIDETGEYRDAKIHLVEDIFLIAASLITTILIFRSSCPRNQKFAALTFIFLPLTMFFFLEGSFGNASLYGMILMSLIIMYCVIFNYNSSKLASTQTELNMATEIQSAMLPSIFPPFPERKEFEIYATMDPAKEVGGDFYDFFIIDEDHLGVVIADVSGKGVPAALFMMISKTVIKNYAMLGISPSEVLMKSNESLCVQNDSKMFVTVWIGILEISTGRMSCANAGHEYPAIFHDGKYELLKDKHGFVLGAMEESIYREYEIQMEKGDRIFVYTDGVPEAMNANDELFGTDRMVEALNRKPEANPEGVLRNIRASVDEYVGNAEQFDDLTMVCLEYKGV